MTELIKHFEKIFIDKINYLGYNFIDSFVKNYDDRFVTLIQINDLNLKDFYSIRINNQWRIIFKWNNGNAEQVEIIDYH